MKRLLNRKGFTLVELIVVIAMIGIMLAVVVPLISTSDARESEAKEYARSFYSNVQELMTDEKLSGTELPTGTKYLLVAAHVTDNDYEYEQIEVYMDYCLTDTPSFSASDINFVELSETPTAPYGGFGEFVLALRKMLLGNDRDGYFYAVVDSKYRVVSAYFTTAGTDAAAIDKAFELINGKKFTNECRVGDNSLLVGAYPYSLCEVGKTVFQLPD